MNIHFVSHVRLLRLQRMMNIEQHFSMQISFTEDSEYLSKSQFFQLPPKRLYIDNLLIAAEGCLIFMFVDVLQIVQKRETRGESKSISLITVNVKLTAWI